MINILEQEIIIDLIGLIDLKFLFNLVLFLMNCLFWGRSMCILMWGKKLKNECLSVGLQVLIKIIVGINKIFYMVRIFYLKNNNKIKC